MLWEGKRKRPNIFWKPSKRGWLIKRQTGPFRNRRGIEKWRGAQWDPKTQMRQIFFCSKSKDLSRNICRIYWRQFQVCNKWAGKKGSWPWRMELILEREMGNREENKLHVSGGFKECKWSGGPCGKPALTFSLPTRMTRTGWTASWFII